MSEQRRHLVSIGDLADDELRRLVRRGADLAASGTRTYLSLKDSIVGIYFRKTSTRTRTAFSSGALRLGAQIVSYGPNDLQENTGETSEDTTRVLSEMLDVFVVRTAGSQIEMNIFAAQERMAVINAMSADEHPTQALADLTTMLQTFGKVDGLRVLYIGEGNNSAAALALALMRFAGVELHLRTPPGYGLVPGMLERAVEFAEGTGASISEHHDMSRLPPSVDVVYTTRWETTGTTKPDENWRTIFAPFQVNESLMDQFPDAVFMHDLPAHRGQEVAAAVLDGRASIAFQQARNKLFSAMAALEWCAGGVDGGVNNRAAIGSGH